MTKDNLTERGAQAKIKAQYGVEAKLANIGVGDFNPVSRKWTVYVTGDGSTQAPSIYRVS